MEGASLWDGAVGEAAEVLCASTAQKKATLCFSDAVTQSVKLAFTPNGRRCVHLWYTVCHSTRRVIGYEWTPQVFPFINLSWAFSFYVSVWSAGRVTESFSMLKKLILWLSQRCDLTTPRHSRRSRAPVWAAPYLWEATGSSCFFQLHFQFFQRPNCF